MSLLIFVGISDHYLVDEKTIILVGATGSGKSTLVDGIVNYILGVNFEDPFRFTVIRLEEEEMKRNQVIFEYENISVKFENFTCKHF